MLMTPFKRKTFKYWANLCNIPCFTSFEKHGRIKNVGDAWWFRSCFTLRLWQAPSFHSTQPPFQLLHSHTQFLSTNKHTHDWICSVKGWSPSYSLSHVSFFPPLPHLPVESTAVIWCYPQTQQESILEHQPALNSISSVTYLLPFQFELPFICNILHLCMEDNIPRGSDGKYIFYTGLKKNRFGASYI